MILVTHFACCHQYKGYWRSCPLGWSYFTVMPGLNLRAGGAHAPEFTVPLGEYDGIKNPNWEHLKTNEETYLNAIAATQSCIQNLYVACTRAKEVLYIIAPETENESVFMKMLKDSI